MRVGVTRLLLVGLALVLAAPAVGLAQPGAAPAQTALGPFVMRPGVVVAADRSVLYLMRPGGGIDAVDVSSGRSLWHVDDAAQPLRVSGDLLVALADGLKTEPASAVDQPYLDVVFLGTRDGLRRGALRLPLPDRVWSSVDDGPGRSLKVAATVEQGDVIISWVTEENELTGVAPGDAANAPARIPRAAAAAKQSGAFRINVASASAQALPATSSAVEALARAPISDGPRLPGVSGTQYLSSDGRHVLASERAGSDEWNKYRWVIYSLSAIRLGELRSAFPQAPFFVAGTKLVFEGRPFVRLVDNQVEREPLKVRAVDLATGSEVWSVALRDTTFNGPFPPGPALVHSWENGPAERGRQEIEAQVLGGTWRALGPAPKRGGQSENAQPNNEIVGAVNALAAHPTDANVLYAGAVNGGVWKTTNATAASPTWIQQTDPQASLSIGALDFDPLDTTSQTLVAGIGRFSSFGRRGGPRSGLLRTTNGGATWTAINGGGALSGKNISGVAARGTRIVVSVNTADNPAVAGLGLFRSTDSGATFTQISSPAGIAFDLVRDPLNSSRLFTGVVSADTVGGVNGIYRSADGGATWAKVSNAAIDSLLVTGTTGNLELAVGRNNNVYLAIVSSGHLVGLFRSGDTGTTWIAMDVPTTHPGGQGAIHLSLVADPTNAMIVYVGGDRTNIGDFGARDFSGRLFRCNAAAARGSQCVHLTHSNAAAPAGGGTASNSAPHADSREMVFDAAGNIIESDDGGIFRRTSPRSNQGDWFSIGNNLQAVELHSVAYDANSNVLVGGAQDNGVGRESVPDSPIWESMGGGDGGDVAVDATSSPGLSSRYSSSQNLGGFRRRVFDANNVQQSSVSPALSVAGGGAAPGFQFTTPIRLNNIDPRRLIIGASNGAYESADQAETIRQLTPAIPINSGGGHPIGYGATGNVNALYVGSADGVWVRLAAPPAALIKSTAYPGTGSGRTVLDLAIDPTNPSVAFAIDSTTVSMTSNGGSSWTDVTGNLPSLGPGTLRSVEHVKNATGEGVVVGTNAGAFVALGSGFSIWSRLGSDLPNVQVFDLDYSRERDLLVAGTLGRGAWAISPSFSTTLFSGTFDANAEGFTYVDDAFGTSQPDYASGTFVNPGGFSGGGLQVVVGGVDNATITNMSGGWRRSFALDGPQFVTLSFDFNMTQTPEYEADELSETLAQIDGQAALVQARVTGNGNGGTPLSTGPQSRVLDLGCLSGGAHTVTLGVRNNKKTLNNESTTLLLDNIATRATGPCP